MSLIGHWGNDCSIALARHHADALGSMPQFEGMESFSVMAVFVGIVLGIIDTGFVEVHHLGRLIASKLGQKVLAFGLVAFSVAISLFLRVNPMRFSALPRVRFVMGSGHRSAICC